MMTLLGDVWVGQWGHHSTPVAKAICYGDYVHRIIAPSAVFDIYKVAKCSIKA